MYIVTWTYFAYSVRVLIFQGIEQVLVVAITYANMVIQRGLVNFIARRFAARGHRPRVRCARWWIIPLSFGVAAVDGNEERVVVAAPVRPPGIDSRRPRRRGVRGVTSWRRIYGSEGSPHRIRVSERACERSCKRASDLRSAVGGEEKAVSCRGPDLSLSSGHPSRPSWCAILRSRFPRIRRSSEDTHGRGSRAASLARKIAWFCFIPHQ